MMSCCLNLSKRWKVTSYQFSIISKLVLVVKIRHSIDIKTFHSTVYSLIQSVGNTHFELRNLLPSSDPGCVLRRLCL